MDVAIGYGERRLDFMVNLSDRRDFFVRRWHRTTSLIDLSSKEAAGSAQIDAPLRKKCKSNQAGLGS